MARQQNIGDTQDWFLGEDKTLKFEIYAEDDATIADITAYAFQWALRRKEDGQEIVLNKTSGAGIAITGAYDADPAVNTQRAEVTIADTDTDALEPGTYYHALKRTNADHETILSYGEAFLKRAAL